MPLVIGRNHEAAQQRRGHIVRVPLQLGGERQDVLFLQRAASRALAPRMPAAMHALLEPRPRAMGMGFVCTMRRPWNGLPHSAYTSLAVR